MIQEGSTSDYSAFASWANRFAAHTNRSIAGSRLSEELREQFGAADLVQAQQWGMIIDDVQTNNAKIDDAQSEVVSAEGECIEDLAMLHGSVSNNDHKDIETDTEFDARSLSGKEAIDYAEQHMPVVRALLQEYVEELDFAQARIAVCLVLEPKTAVLLRLLAHAGAKVGVFAPPEETDQRVAEQLAREGILVQANATWTPEQAHAGALRLLDDLQPNIIIDDGASFARLALAERPELTSQLIGIAEETTSGVRVFDAMQRDHALPVPVIAVNNSPLKTDFDNAHGTGETCVTALQQILGAQWFARKLVAVIGYGPVGKGFALRIRALGARVVVCDIDPVAALRAVYDGFDAQHIDTVLPYVDMVVSATGVRHTITRAHMLRMKSGAAISVIGGIANEVALDELTEAELSEIESDTTEFGSANIQTIQLTDGPQLHIIAHADGVNYTAAGGNPIEIMDLSFAVQASAVAELLRSIEQPLTAGVHVISEQVNRHIAHLALQAHGCSASEAAADNGYDWTLTRFKDTANSANVIQ